MADRIDHVAEAHRIITGPAMRYPEAADSLVEVQIAQVHATLALVEQQRIANRITLGTVLFDTAAQGYVGRLLFTPEHEFSMTELLPDIREGLGL